MNPITVWFVELGMMRVGPVADRAIALLLGAILAATVAAGQTPGAVAGALGGGQVGDVEGTLVSVDLKNTEVREAVGKLCRGAHVRCRIAPRVHGRVSLQLRNIPFEEALADIADQVGAGVLRKGDVFEVAPVTHRTTIASTSVRRTTQSGRTTVEIESLTFRDLPAGEAYRRLFDAVGAQFRIAPSLLGRVSLSLNHCSLESALDRLAAVTRTTCRTVNGRYVVEPRD